MTNHHRFVSLQSIAAWKMATAHVWAALNLNVARAFYASTGRKVPDGATFRGNPALRPVGSSSSGRGATAWLAAPLGRRAADGDDYVRRGERYTAEQRATLAAQVGEFVRLMGDVSAERMWAWPPGEGRGVVVVGGGRVLAQSMLAFWSLRMAGCTLPGELWTFAFERPPPRIERFLAQSLGVRVVVVEDVLPQLRGTDGGGPAVLSDRIFRDLSFFTLKVLAISMSSFREVLMVDADNIVMRDPTFLFDDPLYQRYGAVLWPDYFGLMVDPQLIDVADAAWGHATHAKWTPWPRARAPSQGNPRMDRTAAGAEAWVGDIDYDALLKEAQFPAPRWTHESGQVRRGWGEE